MNNPYEYWLANDAVNAAAAAEGVEFAVSNFEVAMIVGFVAATIAVIPVIAFFVS